MEQRVLVCGGRDYWDRCRIFEILDIAHDANPIVMLITGNAKGADKLSTEWARERKVPFQVFAAEWKTLGPKAGPIRNQRMLDEGKPHMVIAFPGGIGTRDMVSRADNACVPVIRVRPS